MYFQFLCTTFNVAKTATKHDHSGIRRCSRSEFDKKRSGKKKTVLTHHEFDSLHMLRNWRNYASDLKYFRRKLKPDDWANVKLNIWWIVSRNHKLTEEIFPFFIIWSIIHFWNCWTSRLIKKRCGLRVSFHFKVLENRKTSNAV